MNIPPDQPEADAARLRAIERLDLLGTPREERFDRVVRLAKRLFDVPMAAVSLVGHDRQLNLAEVGLNCDEVPLNESFCRHAIRDVGPMVVNDAALDPRFQDNPLVTDDPHLRFYAGQPLSAPGGEQVGTLCIFDDRAREVSQAELDLLRDLAEWVEKEMAAAAQLDRAAEVQRSLLPRSAPDVPGYDIAGECVAANEISGDFFDWFVVDGALQVVLGDVMGKGISAALIGAGVRATIRGASRFNGVEEALVRASAALSPDLEETATFVTVYSARLDPDRHRLTYVDAGHGLAGIVGEDGGFRHLASDGLPLGTLADGGWHARSEELRPGDTFVAVSDGFLDLFEKPRDGLETMQAMIAASDCASDVVAKVIAYSREQVPLDDVTVVVLRKEAS